MSPPLPRWDVSLTARFAVPAADEQVKDDDSYAAGERQEGHGALAIHAAHEGPKDVHG